MKKILLTLAALLTFACTETKLPNKPFGGSTYKKPYYTNPKEAKAFINKFYPSSWIDHVVDGQTKFYYDPMHYHKLGFVNDRGQSFLTENPYYSKVLPNGDVAVDMRYAMSECCLRYFLFWEIIPTKEQRFVGIEGNCPVTGVISKSSIMKSTDYNALLNPLGCDHYVIRKRYVTLVDPWTEKKFLRHNPNCYKIWASHYLYIDKLDFVNGWVDQRHDPLDVNYRNKAVESNKEFAYIQWPGDFTERPDWKI